MFCSLGGDTKKALFKLQKLLDLPDPVPCLSLIEPKNDPEEAKIALCAFLSTLSA